MIKVDKVNIKRDMFGYCVQAIRVIDGVDEQVGDQAILSSHHDAMMYALKHYELPKGD